MTIKEETKKLRRRIEDRLRKDPKAVWLVGSLLGFGCDIENDVHPYAEYTCTACGAVFCWNCCWDSNVAQGGNPGDPERYVLCPVCKKNALD